MLKFIEYNVMNKSKDFIGGNNPKPSRMERESNGRSIEVHQPILV